MFNCDLVIDFQDDESVKSSKGKIPYDEYKWTNWIYQKFKWYCKETNLEALISDNFKRVILEFKRMISTKVSASKLFSL